MTVCTALYQKDSGCFGRTLDLEYAYDEQVVITPRGRLDNRYALIGTATVAEGYPLYYDGMNEVGLGIAGLNFPHSAHYPPPREGAENVAVHQLIPTLLGQCRTVAEAVAMLSRLHLCDRPFSPRYPTATLHWMLADAQRSVVIESTAEGVRVYDNPVGAMTNEPPFPRQLEHWEKHTHLTHREPAVTPPSWGRGSGGRGLPGDFTSPSRFVRAAFLAACPVDEKDPVGGFFHKMSTVEVPYGAVLLPDGRAVISRYTCCMDLGKRVYCYRTYEGQRLRAVRLREAEACGKELVCYPHRKDKDMAWEN